MRRYAVLEIDAGQENNSLKSSEKSLSSIIGECAGDDVVYVARQRRDSGDAAQRRFGALASPRFQRPPRTERTHQTRRDLRILGVERELGVSDEFVAQAVGTVELGVIGLGKGADQRAHPVRIRHRERGMDGQLLYPIE